jgi:hypothetical protein
VRWRGGSAARGDGREGEPLPTLGSALLELAGRRQATSFHVVDHVLDSEECRTLLPALAEQQQTGGFQFSLDWRIDSRLTRQDVRLLQEAGVRRVEVELSSLCDRALDLRGFPTRAIDHLQLLKDLSERNIEARWSIRWGTEDERAEDYVEMAQLVPSICHLAPPDFLPLAPAGEQVGGAQPEPRVRLALPATARPAPDRDQAPTGGEGSGAAFESAGAAQPAQARAALQSLLGAWREAHAPDLLTYSRGPGFVRVLDRRFKRASREEGKASRETVVTLSDKQADIFLFCGEHRPFRAIVERFDGQLSEPALRKFTEMLVDLRLFYRSRDDRFLALPVHKKIVGIG